MQATRAVRPNNASVRQGETGDGNAALISLAEATEIYRALA
ncbi:hypothetical protein ACIGO7_07935 [Streptomyces virginiae]